MKYKKAFSVKRIDTTELDNFIDRYEVFYNRRNENLTKDDYTNRIKCMNENSDAVYKTCIILFWVFWLWEYKWNNITVKLLTTNVYKNVWDYEKEKLNKNTRFVNKSHKENVLYFNYSYNSMDLYGVSKNIDYIWPYIKPSKEYKYDKMKIRIGFGYLTLVRYESDFDNSKSINVIYKSDDYRYCHHYLYSKTEDKIKNMKGTTKENKMIRYLNKIKQNKISELYN